MTGTLLQKYSLKLVPWDRMRFRIRRPKDYDPYTMIKGFVPLKEVRDMNSKSELKIGSLANLHISVQETWIYVTGSLTTFALGHNATNLTVQGFIDAVAKLRDCLQLNVWEGQLTQLEVNVNLTMDHHADIYLRRAHLMRRAKRFRVDYEGLMETVLFNFSTIGTTMYAKGSQIGPPYDPNYLRVEVRFKRHLCRKFKMAEISVSDLIDRTFIQKGFNFLHDEFNKIHFDMQEGLDIEVLPGLTAKERDNLLAMKGAKGIEDYEAMLKRDQQQGKIHHTTVYRKMKDLRLLLRRLEEIYDDLDPVKELRRKVEEGTLNYFSGFAELEAVWPAETPPRLQIMRQTAGKQNNGQSNRNTNRYKTPFTGTASIQNIFGTTCPDPLQNNGQSNRNTNRHKTPFTGTASIQNIFGTTCPDPLQNRSRRRIAIHVNRNTLRAYRNNNGTETVQFHQIRRPNHAFFPLQTSASNHAFSSIGQRARPP